MRLIIALVLAATLALALAPTPAVAQDVSDRTVNLEGEGQNFPLVPVSVRIGSFEKVFPPFDLRVTAPAGNYWLAEAQANFRNMTNRTIIGLSVHVDFPDTEGPQQYRMGYDFTVGEIPERATYTKDKVKAHLIQHPSLYTQPRGVVTIALGPEYSDIKQGIEQRQPVSTIHSVWIRIYQVYFKDGTGWNGGYERPDPNDPTAYIRGADPKDFRISAPVR